jgi:hypothetical protein
MGDWGGGKVEEIALGRNQVDLVEIFGRFYDNLDLIWIIGS